MVVGDFNEITCSGEKEGGAPRPNYQMARFNNTINFCGLREVGFVGPRFTWLYQKRDGTQIRERLDRALATHDWFLLFPTAKLYHKSSSDLDHSPLLLSFIHKPRKVKQKNMFWFESMWVHEARCEQIVAEAWNEGLFSSSDFPVVCCLDECRKKLEGWNKSEFGHVGKKIALLQKQLEWLELQSSSPDVNRNLRDTRVELNCWLEKENEMWKQRSCLNWFQNGDRNTRFFHAKASARAQKNLIEGVFDENEIWREDGKEIERVFVDYYSELSTSSNPSNFEDIVNAIQPKVSEDMNASLIKEFQAKEVYRALKQMYPLKAPGPDGMPPLFFQHFWSLVGSTVTKTVLDFLNFGISPPKFNETYIVLIPKTKNPLRVTEFQPISLCNVIYKLASKTLVNRLKKILPAIISDSQSAFVNGRLITDNVLVAFETMHHINQRKGDSKGEMAIKLDMSKAYDRLEWTCLEKIMEKLGFHPSPNIASNFQEEIKSRFGAQVIKQHEKYLGLPSLVGRNKKNTFREIKEKLVKKLAGWKEKLLSKAGKEARIGSNPSYAWRSIMAAQDIVRRGSRWQVGNGSSIKIWSDKWLPTPPSHKVVSPPTVWPPEATVDSLIDADEGTWKREVVQSLFLPHEAEMIQGIALCSRLPEDRLVWAPTANGHFSVKSAYSLAVETCLGSTTWEVSDDSNFRKFWKYIWKLNVPHKVRHFTWRACKNILPTKDNLVRRKVLIDGGCDECKTELESSGHVFWTCPRAQEIWAMTNLIPLNQNFPF
ncbi:hypothetical protein SO802_010827 [Lithocarpus litseifolius]|uniref:Reverse transcriptase domain-containing protein n=1 Tax=Lithocarpus litseifolius TaxID=425828 RepID=A0AAW2DJG5_9ROSI